MKQKTVFCFTGQGSHYYQMGKELFQQNNTFKYWMNSLDEIVRSLINESVLSVIYGSGNPVNDPFDRTLYTHPAIFMIEYSLYRCFLDMNIFPDYVMGLSLGEFTSAVVSGIYSYGDALKIIIKHAEEIERTCQKGGMMAILHDVSLFDQLRQQYPEIELASVNAQNHFVIAGPSLELTEIGKIFKSQQIMFQTLAVSYAFHSKHIEPAARGFLDYLSSFHYKKPTIPFISCAQASQIDDQEIFSSGYFWNVTYKPILCRQAVEFMEKNGVYYYLDLGPSGTAANLIKLSLKQNSTSLCLPTLTLFNRDISNINKAVELLRKG